MVEHVLAWVIAFVCALALVCLLAARALERRRSRSLARRRWARAAAGEALAEDLLAERGYARGRRQAGGVGWSDCWGAPPPGAVPPDLRVVRDGRRYVAEVKTGASAPLLTNAATRRQLLEYCVAYQVDSVLLVDVEAQAVREVTFRFSESSR